MNKDIFLEVTALKKFANIDELVEALDAANWFDDKFADNAIESAKKARVRSEMSKHKDADGMRLFVNIETPDGEKIYKQETLFNLGDYEQVVNYHRDRGQYHINMAKTYRDRAYKRFHRWIQLEFVEFDPPNRTKKATR